MRATHQRLYINIDHVATLRQARRTDEPDPVAAALLCEDAGADGITAHLREDRRHIQDADVEALARRSTPRARRSRTRSSCTPAGTRTRPATRARSPHSPTPRATPAPRDSPC